MNPFDKVTYSITRDDIDYTYGGTVICTYTENNEEMVGVSLLNRSGVIYVKASEVTKIN